MNRHHISVTKDEKTYNFEVADLPHHDSGHCKFEVFRDDQLVAGFEPDARQILHICKNTGAVDEEILHLLADEIERYTWYAAD
ncbi:hypothetical protein HQ865_14175 [Mucilaginibacter mali]|uniref:Uncharacterized protein n=1 Tax=Mucilaginibacter mali TaxID=2740462 RepID=A0A7D4Q1X4_9SPHI|nr:hypothetical protein [Mucilaginibacter mali]QKJ30846.1 hypothetical protein HQ865_14175 [Mucilaginibacter mali]